MSITIWKVRKGKAEKKLKIDKVLKMTKKYFKAMLNNKKKTEETDYYLEKLLLTHYVTFTF